jgi:hypothetical protein
MKYTLTARELSNFFGQLGMLIHSGISLTEGLAILHDESQTDTVKSSPRCSLPWKKPEVLHRQWKLPEDSPILLFLI